MGRMALTNYLVATALFVTAGPLMVPQSGRSHRCQRTGLTVLTPVPSVLAGPSAAYVLLRNEVAVVVDEKLRSLLVAEPGDVGQPFEVAFARGPRREQQQHRRRIVGLVAECMQSTNGDVEKVPSGRVDPARTIEESNRAGQDENDSEIVLWKCVPGPPPFGAMSTRYKPNSPSVDAVVAR